MKLVPPCVERKDLLMKSDPSQYLRPVAWGRRSPAFNPNRCNIFFRIRSTKRNKPNWLACLHSPCHSIDRSRMTQRRLREHYGSLEKLSPCFYDCIEVGEQGLEGRALRCERRLPTFGAQLKRPTPAELFEFSDNTDHLIDKYQEIARRL